LQGVIIQEFDYVMSCDGIPFFRGDASFGYFTKDALTDQLGLDGGNSPEPWLRTFSDASNEAERLTMDAPENQSRFYQAHMNRPRYHLAAGQLDALGECAIVPNGGSEGQGYVHSRLRVDPSDWYFPCHFHQDPVMPGSLGVEAIFQAMRLFALHQNLGESLDNPQIVHREQHSVLWRYRGQIDPGENQVELEVHITSIENNNNRITVTGDASLWKRDIRIYEVKQVAIDICEWPAEGR
jgi:3-hydroxymyristoyl/3-hydroxydecanoyl-(acyl carrier protein) dehydratase